MAEAQDQSSLKKGLVGAAGGAAIGSAASLALAPAVVSTLGFTSAGIAAGSTAAGMMSAAAVAGGGGVAAGSTVAVLQTVGAAGLMAAGAPVVLGVAAVGGVVGAVWGGVTFWRSRNKTGVVSSPLFAEGPVVASTTTTSSSSSASLSSLNVSNIEIPSSVSIHDGRNNRSSSAQTERTEDRKENEEKKQESAASPISAFLPGSSVVGRSGQQPPNSTCAPTLESPTDSNLLECPMCLIAYDNSDRCPLILIACGHSICLGCVGRLTTEGCVKCPMCSATTSASQIVKNYGLVQAVQAITALSRSS